jgi:hypothetical protein
MLEAPGGVTGWSEEDGTALAASVLISPASPSLAAARGSDIIRAKPIREPSRSC